MDKSLPRHPAQTVFRPQFSTLNNVNKLLKILKKVKKRPMSERQKKLAIHRLQQVFTGFMDAYKCFDMIPRHHIEIRLRDRKVSE